MIQLPSKTVEQLLFQWDNEPQSSQAYGLFINGQLRRVWGIKCVVGGAEVVLGGLDCTVHVRLDARLEWYGGKLKFDHEYEGL